MSGLVITFTPSPTLDLGGTVDNLIPDEKCYVHEQIKSPGGNGINAARILTRLKIPTIASGFVGGSVGEEIKSLLRDEKVQCDFIQIKGHSRICVTVSNKKDHRQTRLTFPGPKIISAEKKKFLHQILKNKNAKLLIIGGSLPEGFSPSDIKKILKMAQKQSIPSLVDCPGHVLRQIIEARPFFIKPNLLEFQGVVNSKVTSIRSVQSEALQLLKFIPYICISSVEGGALFVTRSGTYFGRIPKIEVLSTVGAGDSMVGSMAAQFFKGNLSDQDILRWGLAASAATLSHAGTAFGTAKEIQFFYKKTKVDRV